MWPAGSTSGVGGNRRTAHNRNLWLFASKFAILREGKVQGCIPIKGTAPEATMSVVPNTGNGKITVPEILQRKSSGAGSQTNRQKISCLTAYDYPTARLLDEAGVDVLLVGDSLGMVVLGHDSTLPVTIEDMLHHTAAVRRGSRKNRRRRTSPRINRAFDGSRNPRHGAHWADTAIGERAGWLPSAGQ